MSNVITRKELTISLCILLLAPLCASAASQVGGGDLHFLPKGADPVLFSHEKHVIGKNLKCTKCHYQLFQMAKGSYKMDMSRITKGEFCGHCHNGTDAFDVKDKANCFRCHHS